MKSKVRMRTVHRKQRGDPPPSQEFHLQFLHLHYLGCYFYYSSVNLGARIKSYKTCDLMIPSFKRKSSTELHPLSRYTQIGDDTGITGSNSGPKTQGQKMTKIHLVEWTC
jgi:hypothetical protein